MNKSTQYTITPNLTSQQENEIDALFSQYAPGYKLGGIFQPAQNNQTPNTICAAFDGKGNIMGGICFGALDSINTGLKNCISVSEPYIAPQSYFMIMDIVVEPECQNQGIGSSLLDYAEQQILMRATAIVLQARGSEKLKQWYQDRDYTPRDKVIFQDLSDNNIMTGFVSSSSQGQIFTKASSSLN